jgi:hypothetical protein
MSERHDYPRGLPYRPPDHVIEREARLRHWTLLLAAGTTVAVTLTVALGLYFANRASRRADSLVIPSSDPIALRPSALRPPLEDEPKPPPEDPPSTVPPPAPKKAADTSPPSGPSPDPKREPILQTLGGLTAAHLYQTYLNIGFLADAWENDVYEAAEAKDLLAKLTALMDKVDQQLAELARAGLDEDDQKALQRTRELAGLLREQAKELKAYWETSNKEHAAKYHKIREKVWAGITEVLKAE